MYFYVSYYQQPHVLMHTNSKCVTKCCVYRLINLSSMPKNYHVTITDNLKKNQLVKWSHCVTCSSITMSTHTVVKLDSIPHKLLRAPNLDKSTGENSPKQMHCSCFRRLLNPILKMKLCIWEVLKVPNFSRTQRAWSRELKHCWF